MRLVLACVLLLNALPVLSTKAVVVPKVHRVPTYKWWLKPGLTPHPTQPLLSWKSGPRPSVPFDAPMLVPEGFGQNATGGAGGTSMVITTLNDVVDTTANTAAGVVASPGPDGLISLREALVGAQTSGVVFGPRLITISAALSGDIDLSSEIEIENNVPSGANFDDVTLDFSGAANQGVQILTFGLSFRIDNFICRYVKSRNGTTASTTRDSLRVDSGTNGMIDHCSPGAGDDGDMDVVGNSTDITVQWCLIGPGFGAGAVLVKGAGVTRITYHHNLIMKSDGGTPRWPECASGDIQWINNVFYTDDTPIPRMEAASSWPPDTAPIEADIVGNYFKQGPSLTAYSGSNPVIYFFNDRTHSAASSFHVSANAVANAGGITHTTQSDIFGNDVVTMNGTASWGALSSQTSADQARIDVTGSAGARLPCLDAWDSLTISVFVNATAGTIDHQDDHGGFPDLTVACSGGGAGRGGSINSGKVIHRGNVKVR